MQVSRCEPHLLGVQPRSCTMLSELLIRGLGIIKKHRISGYTTVQVHDIAVYDVVFEQGIAGGAVVAERGKQMSSFLNISCL